MKFDIVIIGAGPAGLLAAWCLEGTGISYTIVEQGKLHSKRDRELPYDVSYGFGGAGLFSDGKLSYSPAASQLWRKLDPVRLHSIYEKIRQLFSKVGLELREWSKVWVENQNSLEATVKEYESVYVNEEQRMDLLEILYSELSSKIIFGKIVNEVRIVNDEYIIVCEDGSTYTAYNLIMATGKASCFGLFEENNEIQWNYWSEMGVRIEVDSEEFVPKEKDTLDYKYIEKLNDTTEVRTFCSCKKGVVRKSLYGNHVTFNGEAINNAKAKANIGIVVRTQNINSVYAEEMRACYSNEKEEECNIIDYRKGYPIIGTQTDNEIRKVICHLVKKECTGKVYGPEIEKYGYYPLLDNELMCLQGLYFVGDATAIFRGLLAAFISGGYVANLIVENRKKSIKASMEKLKIKKSDTDDMKLIFTAQSKAFFYCRDVICQFVFEKGYLPINPFRVFDYFLGDRVQRDLIRRGNNQLIKTCDELWVFGSIADGVLFEIASAIDQGKKIRFFTVGATVQEIKEITTAELTFEPEVHARQIKKHDIIDFINQQNRSIEENEYIQLSLEDFGFDQGK